MKKVTIQLRPYDALAILTFMREFINDTNKHETRLTAIHETVNTYEQEVFKSISNNQLEDAILECNVNYLTNRPPPKNNQP